MNASCLVRTGKGLGTGVHLNSGYVITAAHVVDSDRDGYIRDDEDMVMCDFFYKDFIHSQKFEVIYSSKNIDFAILKPILHSRYSKKKFASMSNVSPGLQNGKPGDEIFTVGAIRGYPLIISKGFVGFSVDEYQMASCYISKGNSGGGIFNKDNELLGIVTAVAILQKYSSGRIELSNPNVSADILSGEVTIPVITELNGVCRYTSITSIRNDLNDRFLGELLDKPRSKTLLEKIQEPWIYGLVRVGFNLALFFGLVAFCKEEILG